ncbi:ATPase AAA [Spirochaetia bacterium]|nr:ATPase AAA [Spirochaetia bacterium]
MDEKKPIELNDEQRAAAYCKENAVVAAGAGSGKTAVLASRFAFLITENDDHPITIDQILTLTFTQKAVAQMYQRIYSTLSYIAAHDTGVKQRRAREAIDDFFHARIQTLDSYSTSLVKQAAVRYGISPDFAIDKDRCRALAAEAALPFLIARRHHPAIEKLYRKKKPVDIAGDIFAATVFNYSHIDAPPDFVADTRKQFDLVCEEWQRMVSLISDKIHELEELIAEGEAEDGFLTLLAPLVRRFSSGAVAFPGEGDFRAYFDALLAAPPEACVPLAEGHPLQGAVFQCLFFMNELYGVNMTRGKRGSRGKELIRELRGLFGAFSSLAVFCVQGGIILSLMALLNEFQGIFLEKKRAEGVLTFTDAARLARAILRDHPDIRQNEKNAFKVIMIDEFQDNNSLQKDLLFLLAEKPERTEKSVPDAKDIAPGKLFFVGDEKQSVYRFRGADVSVFRLLQNELAAADLSLKTNYRSAPALIGAFNALFGGGEFDPSGGSSAGSTGGSFAGSTGGSFAGSTGGSSAGSTGEKPPAEFPSVFIPEHSVAEFPASPSLPPYEAAYTPLRAGKDSAGKIGIHILDTDAGTGGDEAQDGTASEEEELLGGVENEALFTAERIKALLEETDEQGQRKYQPADIALLFRTYEPQRLFEKHLRLLRIPYASEGISGFFSDGPVNDLAAALRLTAYPLDTEAYAVTLRSPFVSLSLPGLTVCLAQFNMAKAEGGGHGEPFSDDVLPLLSEEDRGRFRLGQGLYHRIREKAAVGNIGELVSELWYAEGYRYETEWNPQTVVYRELYDYLFNLAVKADAEGLSLAGFTDRLMKIREEGSRLEDMDIPLERPGAVRLMTIHKSKGLEFPVVFLCCCGKWGRRNNGDAEVYETTQGGLSFNPPLPPECTGMDKVRRNFFYEQGRAEEKRKKTAELRRLLYVAMTRAEKELYISGSFSLGEDNADAISVRLQRAIEEKKLKQDKKDDAEGTVRIPGDAILDNDTFFGLLLPAVAARIGASGEGALPSFFTLEAIPIYTEDHIKNREGRGAVYSNDRKGLARFLAKAAPFYGTAEPITTQEIARNHRTPSSLGGETGSAGPADPGFQASPGYCGEGGADIFKKVDAILGRFAEKGETFTPADFGTIAHGCVEALLKGVPPLIPPRLGGHLSLTEADALLAAGQELARRFLESPLGKAARGASLRKSEYPFRSLVKESGGGELFFFINGTIDLLFEEGDTVHVADFKTDSREDPAEHLAQMACYYRAASELRAKPCRVWLYYLRTGHAVEMTEAAKGGLELFTPK